MQDTSNPITQTPTRQIPQRAREVFKRHFADREQTNPATQDNQSTNNQTPPQTNQQEGTRETNQFEPQTQYDDQTEYFPGVAKPQPESLVYEWQAPSRPFKKRSKQFYTTIITISILISLILFFAGQFLPIAVIVAVVFLFYVLSTIEPPTVVTQLTTYGIRYEEQLYYWDELGRFWLDEVHDQRMIHIEVSRFPQRLTLMLGDAQEDELVAILSEVLLFEKPAPTVYEKIAAWLEKKVPLDVDK